MRPARTSATVELVGQALKNKEGSRLDRRVVDISRPFQRAQRTLVKVYSPLHRSSRPWQPERRMLPQRLETYESNLLEEAHGCSGERLGECRKGQERSVNTWSAFLVRDARISERSTFYTPEHRSSKLAPPTLLKLY